MRNCCRVEWFIIGALLFIVTGLLHGCGGRPALEGAQPCADVPIQGIECPGETEYVTCSTHDGPLTGCTVTVTLRGGGDVPALCMDACP